jgi:hypothetical protein
VPVNNISIRDIRPLKDQVSLDRDGVMVRDIRSKMGYEDFADPIAVQEIYLLDVQAMLQTHLGTENVAVLEYLVLFFFVQLNYLN